MSNLLECMAERLGVTVAEMVGFSALESLVNSLQLSLANQVTISNNNFAATNQQVNQLNLKVSELITESATKDELNSLSDALDSLNETTFANAQTFSQQIEASASLIGEMQVQLDQLQANLISLTNLVNLSKAELTSLGSNLRYSLDSDYNVTWSAKGGTIILDPVLTADRVVTIDSELAKFGSYYHFVNLSTGGFSWNIAGLKTLAVDTWCDVQYDDSISSWVLTGYGVL